MALFGNIGAFNEKVKCFDDYMDGCDAFMVANAIDEGKMTNLVLVLGGEMFTRVKNLCSPDAPKTKSYNDLKGLLAELFTRKPIMIAERHKFWMANQGEHESIADFIMRLKQLASTCAFGEFLHEALRDRLVSGLHPNMARKQTNLLSKGILSFEDSRVKCLADELAGTANKEHMGCQAARTEDRATNQLQPGKRWECHFVHRLEKGGSAILRTIRTYICKCCRSSGCPTSAVEEIISLRSVGFEIGPVTGVIK